MRAGLPVGADLPDEFTVGRFEPQQEAGESLYLEREGSDLGAEGWILWRYRVGGAHGIPAASRRA